MMQASTPRWIALLLLLSACGEEPAAQPPPPTAQSSGDESPAQGGMEVEGIMGTIPER
jgi:hypothetical protein